MVVQCSLSPSLTPSTSCAGQLEAGNQTFQEFAASAREDPAQVFGSREEALETYREILARVQPGLEQLLPRDTLTGGSACEKDLSHQEHVNA